MAAPVEPQTPEEEAALRELAARHRRQHRWVALVSSMVVSVHTTIILHTIWHDWPLNARDLMWLVFFVVNALGGLVWLAWGLRGLREEEAIDRRWTLQGRTLASPGPCLAHRRGGDGREEERWCMIAMTPRSIGMTRPLTGVRPKRTWRPVWVGLKCAWTDWRRLGVIFRTLGARDPIGPAGALEQEVTVSPCQESFCWPINLILIS